MSVKYIVIRWCNFILEKRNFLNAFEEEDKNLISMIYEDIELCKKINYPVYTSVFVPPQIWSKLSTMKKNLGIDVYTKGLNDTSEKRICMFSPAGDEVYSYDYPVVYFTVTGGNKFRELEHRHFLAGIMSLGIKREKLGDLIVRDGICYGIVVDELYDHLKTELRSIGKVEVNIEEGKSEEVPRSEYEDQIYLVSSLRLDNLVAAITGQSRSGSVELIDEGLVTQNYSVKRRKDASIDIGDILSIRRYGKYLFQEIVGESKKGKTRILLKKYI